MRGTRWASWRAKTVLIAAGAALAVAGSGVTTAQAAPVWRLPDSLHSDRVTLPSQCVSTSPLTHVDHVRPDGIRQAATPAQGAASTDSQARAYYFRTGGGEVAQIVPPTGWKPVAATDQELRAYGFPARPTDPVKLAHWTATMSKWKRVGRPGMCSTNLYNTLSHTVNPLLRDDSPHWAGGVNVGPTQYADYYSQTDLKWVQPRFIYPCPAGTGAATTIWSGLGGYYNVGDTANSFRLIQDGTDQGGEMWWEALSPQYEVPEQIWTGSVANPGDTVESLVIFNYYSDTDTEDDFYLFDSTNGESQSTSFTSLGGYSALNYYDGSSADFISEAPQIGTDSSDNPIYSQLARPAGDGTIYFPYAETDGKPIADFTPISIDQIRNGVTEATTSFDGIHAWYNSWKAC